MLSRDLFSKSDGKKWLFPTYPGDQSGNQGRKRMAP